MIIAFWMAFFVISMIFSNNTNAQSYLDVEVIPGETTIQLKWGHIAEKYELYLFKEDGKMSKVWEGNKLDYSLTQLEANTPYKLKLSAIDENGVPLDNVVINSSTKRTDSQLNNIKESNAKFLKNSDETIYYPMVKSNLNLVYNENRVVLSWDGIPSELNNYEIQKNGEFLATVKGNKFTDFNIKPDEVYTYSVVSYKKIPQEKIVQKKKEIQKSVKKKLNMQEEKSVFFEPKIVSGTIRISEESVFKREEVSQEQDSLLSKNSESQVKSFQYPEGFGYLLRYTTFIPMDYAPNPWCKVNCNYKYFGGDNRGFNVWSNKFRTRLDSYVIWDWNENPKGVTANPQTGWTYGYDANKKLLNQKKADAVKDHRVWMEEKGKDWIYHRGSVASSNPLTAAPDIDAFYYAKVWKSGKGEFYGVHDQAPSHEFYIMNYPGDLDLPIHQAKHVDFEYLFPWTTKKEWQVNVY